MFAVARAIEVMHKVHEAAALLGIDKSTVYRHIASGKLPAVRAGRSIRIPESAFQVYLQPAAETPGPASAVAGMRPGPGPTPQVAEVNGDV